MPRDGFVGVKNLHIAEMTNTETLTYATPVDVGSYVGLVSIQIQRSIGENPAYANDEEWLKARTDTGGTGTLSIRDANHKASRDLLARLAGYIITTEGDLLATDNPPIPCALMVERTGYIHGQRKLLYWVEFGKPDFEANTKEENAEVGQLDIPFSFKPVELADGVRTATRDSFYGNSTYDDFFDAVVKTATAMTYDATLSALTIGSLTLSPTFAASTTSYTTSTTNASDNITATPTSSDANVVIKNGSTEVASGSAATWSAGSNTVTVKVTHGNETKTYTVTVTKS